MDVTFQALEYNADDQFHAADYRITGSTALGWMIFRNNKPHLELGPGYRLLKSVACGVCSTDLDRRFLPFALPQITGHEFVAVDMEGRRHVVEINASHQARGVDHPCPFCRAGLPTHCPDRLVLGIDSLPGGFGPYVLAPVHAAIPLPDAIPTGTAVLIEPFAAALHAVMTIAPQPDQTIAVLGPRRLGLLVIAALGGYCRRHDLNTRILALSHHPRLLELARHFGATRTLVVEGGGESLAGPLADVVIDTTGNPQGVELAIRLARQELHLKTTCGQTAAGLRHLTELVVDELGIERLPANAPELSRTLSHPARQGAGARPIVAWLTAKKVPPWLEGAARVIKAASALDALRVIEREIEPPALPRADAAVVELAEEADAAIRPDPQRQISLVRPHGKIFIHPEAPCQSSPMICAVGDRGLKLTSSRCGDFHAALELIMHDPQLLTMDRLLVTHHFDRDALGAAFAAARSRGEHQGGRRSGPG